jgi:hypothetical protein
MCLSTLWQARGPVRPPTVCPSELPHCVRKIKKFGGWRYIVPPPGFGRSRGRSRGWGRGRGRNRSEDRTTTATTFSGLCKLGPCRTNTHLCAISVLVQGTTASMYTLHPRRGSLSRWDLWRAEARDMTARLSAWSLPLLRRKNVATCVAVSSFF